MPTRMIRSTKNTSYGVFMQDKQLNEREVMGIQAFIKVEKWRI